jgi:hypothetical protein
MNNSEVLFWSVEGSVLFQLIQDEENFIAAFD